jgi:hypothetical protein
MFRSVLYACTCLALGGSVNNDIKTTNAQFMPVAVAPPRPRQPWL